MTEERRDERPSARYLLGRIAREHERGEHEHVGPIAGCRRCVPPPKPKPSRRPRAAREGA